MMAPRLAWTLRPTALLAVIALAAPLPARAQCVSLTTSGVAATQSFDTLSNTAGSTTNNLTITGWFLTESGGGTRDNEQYAVDTGGSNTGDTYSYGATGTTERALGGLRSGTLIPSFGACFTNNTGGTVTSLGVAYTGEQWRLGTAGRTDRIDFQYSTDATSLVSGTWTDTDALDFTTPVTTAIGAKDGNAAANRTALSSTISGLTIPSGASFWIRWSDIDVTGADDGLAVDDFSLTPSGGTAVPSLSVDDVTLVEGDAGTTTFTFSVSLSAPAPVGGVTFDIATADGTATTAGNDYVARSLTGQSIPAGSSTYAFDVTVNGDTTPEPDEAFLVRVTNVVGADVTRGQATGTIVNDELTPIASIQGDRAASPLAGATVTTRGVVTGVKPNGFFIQEPDASADASPATSEGILVFTSSAPPPAAAVGHLVQVTGTVAEFVPSSDPLQPPLTEIVAPSVILLSSGHPLPAPVPLTAAFPDPAGPVDQLERLEGMRVQVASLTVVGPTLGGLNEVSATATTNGVFHGVVTGVTRPFREPGLPADDPPPSGTIPPIPRFDANPERIRVDGDGQVGAAAIDAGAGAVVTGVVGPLDYAFRTYTILPDPATPPGVAGGPVPVAVTSPTAAEVTVASFNLQRFFDDVNDPALSEPVLTAAAYDQRLKKASLAVRDFLRAPDIVGVQEVEGLAALSALAARIGADAVAAAQPDPQYAAWLVEGNDVGGIDVGFLVKTAPVTGSTPRVAVNAVVQERAGTLFVNPDASSELLNDRPPLRLDAVVHDAGGTGFALTVIVNHLRSLSGATDLSPGSNGWATVGDRVRAKRLKQAEDLADLVQARQAATPAERIVLVGDFNAFDFNDGLGDSVGVIKGTPAPDEETAVPGDGVDLVDPDLQNLEATLPPSERYSYVFDGNAQALDHVLVNQALLDDTTARRLEHARIGADFPETARNDDATPLRLSDHDPAVAYFTFGPAADLSVTKTNGLTSTVPGRAVTYTVVAANAGPSAANGASVVDAVPAAVTGVTWTCAGAGGGTCAPSGAGSLSETVDLPAGGSVTFSVTGTVSPSATGSLSNTAAVAAPGGIADPDPADSTATDADTLTPRADLSITKTNGRAAVAPGAPVAWTIVAANAGPSDASGARVTDTLPAAVLGATWTCAGAGGGTCSASGTGGIDDTVDLPAGGSVTYTLTGTVDPAAVPTLSNTATVAAPGGVTDPNPADNSATDTDTVGGLRFYTVTPCRVVDTRGGAPIGGPVLQAQETRVLPVAGHCGIPADAKAVSLNVTATEPTLQGHVRLFPAGEAPPNISTVNYVAGLTRANNATGILNAEGDLAVFVSQASGTVHLVLDVNGYYR